jgi:hypothetical protein
MVKFTSLDPQSPKLALEQSEKRMLNWFAIRAALVWAIAVGTAFVLFAQLAFPRESQVMWEAATWYPFSFTIAFYLKRRALFAKAQAMLEAANNKMRDEASGHLTK